MSTIQLNCIIQAPAAEVFRNFSSAMTLREWLCDVATLDPRPGGRIYLYWNSGYYTCGEFIHLETNKRIEFTWHGHNEPTKTQVKIELEEKDGKTHLSLEHSGLGDDDTWKTAHQEIQQGWQSGLRNLVHITEIGPDLRITKKPMMGILLAQFDTQRAEELGVPVKEGVWLGGVIDGMGASRAGLQKDDIVIEINGIPTPTIPTIGVAIRGREAGDKVSLTFFRGPEKHTAEMELSHRPMPEIPANGAALSAKLRNDYQDALVSLHNTLEGISDDEATHPPAEGEWNIKEIIAHLIHNESGLRSWIQQLVLEQEQVSDNFVDNLTIRNQATVAAYLSLEALMVALEYEISETVELVKRLPKEFSAHKGTFWRMGQTLVVMPGHVSDHIPQIEASLAAARV